MTAEDRFGRNVRRKREEAGLKQADLASKVEEFGVKLHPSAIAKIELRDVDSPRSIRLNEADAIATALEVPLADLVGTPEQVFEEAVRLTRAAVEHSRDSEALMQEAFGLLRTLKESGFDPHDVSAEIQKSRELLVHYLAQIERKGRHGVDQETE